jgi:monoamine oxidase
VTAIDLADDTAKIIAPGGPYEAERVVLATPPTAWPTINPEPGAEYRVAMGEVVKYLSDTPRRFWIPEALSPSSTSERYGMTWEGTDNQIGYQPELSLFAGGPAATNALVAWESGQVHQFYDATLNQVYAGYPDNRVEWPRFMPWPREPYTMTGYSCPQPGDVCTVWPNYAQGFGPGGKLWFAGEHTCPAFFGYMEGALEGGFFTGMRIQGWSG